MDVVIFACVHNAGRSQMAAALFAAAVDPGKARALSAGTDPGPRVHPEVAAALAEVGIDVAHRQPQLLTAELAAGATHLITMAAAMPARSSPAPDIWTGSWTTRQGRAWRQCGRSATTLKAAFSTCCASWASNPVEAA